MSTLFLICAGLGGTLLLLQFLASLIGFGGDDGDGGHDHAHVGADHHDVGHDGHDAHHHGVDGRDHPQSSLSTWLFSVLSFKSIMTAIAFFGLGGLTATAYQFDELQAFGIALLCGLVALYAVGMLMRLLYSLKADGTIRIDRAVGKTGTVYLKIPGNRGGSGKVTLTVQNRSVEYLAITANDAIPTGSKVVVVAITGPDTVEVALAPVATSTPENASHV